MSSTSTPSSRAALLKAVLPHSPHVDNAIAQVVPGLDLPPDSEASPPPTLVAKATLANQLASLSDDNEHFVQAVVKDSRVSTLSDVARKLDAHDIESLASSPQPTSAKPLDVKTFQTRLFYAEPSAVVHRLVDDNKVRKALFFGPEY
jgi:hypothetical protein